MSAPPSPPPRASIAPETERSVRVGTGRFPVPRLWRLLSWAGSPLPVSSTRQSAAPLARGSVAAPGELAPSLAPASGSPATSAPTTGWNVVNAPDSVSTGTPGSHWKHRSHYLIGQFPRRTLDRLPGILSLDIQLRFRLAHFDSGSLARGVQCGFALSVPLLSPLLPHFEDLGARLTKVVGIFGRFSLGLGDCPVGILHGAFGPGTA